MVPCCDVVPASAVERDADHSARVALASAFLWIAGDVDLAFRAAVTAQARRRIVFGHRDAEGGAAFAVCDCGVELSFRPARRQKLLANDGALPVIRPGLAISDEFRRRRDLDLCIARRALAEALCYETPECRW